MRWQWHQLDHVQIICTSLQTDDHAIISPLSFLQAGCPSCHPTNSVKALKDPTMISIKGKCAGNWSSLGCETWLALVEGGQQQYVCLWSRRWSSWRRRGCWRQGSTTSNHHCCSFCTVSAALPSTTMSVFTGSTIIHLIFASLVVHMIRCWTCDQQVAFDSRHAIATQWVTFIFCYN